MLSIRIWVVLIFFFHFFVFSRFLWLWIYTKFISQIYKLQLFIVYFILLSSGSEVLDLVASLGHGYNTLTTADDLKYRKRSQKNLILFGELVLSRIRSHPWPRTLGGCCHWREEGRREGRMTRDLSSMEPLESGKRTYQAQWTRIEFLSFYSLSFGIAARSFWQREGQMLGEGVVTSNRPQEGVQYLQQEVTSGEVVKKGQIRSAA